MAIDNTISADEPRSPFSLAVLVTVPLVVSTVAMWSRSLVPCATRTYMVDEGPNDHQLAEEELISVTRWRAKAVFTLAPAASIIAFVLTLLIKDQLNRLNYGQKQGKDEKEIYSKQGYSALKGEDEDIE